MHRNLRFEGMGDDNEASRYMASLTTDKNYILLQQIKKDLFFKTSIDQERWLFQLALVPDKFPLEIV